MFNDVVLKPEEKILKVLEFLKNQIEIKSLADSEAHISTDNFIYDIYKRYINKNELDSILGKLEKDFRLISIIEVGRYASSFFGGKTTSYELPSRILLLNKQNITQKYYEYLEITGKKPTEIRSDHPILKLSLSKDNEVILNNTFKLKKFQEGKENQITFQYLLENSNIEIQIKELEEKAPKRKFTKELYDIIRGFGLGKNLQEIFFDIKTETILFRNPVTKEFFDKYLSENRLTYLPLSINSDFSNKNSE